MKTLKTKILILLIFVFETTYSQDFKVNKRNVPKIVYITLLRELWRNDSCGSNEFGGRNTVAIYLENTKKDVKLTKSEYFFILGKPIHFQQDSMATTYYYFGGFDDNCQNVWYGVSLVETISKRKKKKYFIDYQFLPDNIENYFFYNNFNPRFKFE